MSLNVIVISGNLTKDPEIKDVNDSQVVNVTIANNRNYTKASGDTVKEVTFVDCEAWGTVAEAIDRKARKGDTLIVTGRLKQDQWETDGQKRSKLKIAIEKFQVYKKLSDAEKDRLAQENRDGTTPPSE